MATPDDTWTVTDYFAVTPPLVTDLDFTALGVVDIPAARTIIPMPDDAPERDRIRSIIPAAFHAKSWIAGSAATRWGQHGDVDVWITVDGWDEWSEMWDHFQNLGTILPTRQSDEQYSFMSNILYAQDGLQILMPSHHEMGIESVVDTFDISCHAAAVPLQPGTAAPYIHTNYTPPPLVRVLQWANAPNTLRRLFKFSERYGDWSWLKATEERDFDAVANVHAGRLATAAFRLSAMPAEDVKKYNMLKVDVGF